MIYGYYSTVCGGTIHYHDDLTLVTASGKGTNEIPEPMFFSGSYAYFDTSVTDNTVAYYQNTFSNFVYLSSISGHTIVLAVYKDPSKVMDHIGFTAYEVVNNALSKLGLPKVYNSYQPVRARLDKVVTNKSASVQHMIRILRDCPKVTVTKPKLCAVKQYISKERRILKKMADDNEPMWKVIERLENIKCNIEWLKLALNDKHSDTEQWQYPATQEQFNALCLYQGYTPHFNSCQYAKIHELTEKGAMLLVSTAHQYTVYSTRTIEDITTENFVSEQMSDFKTGLCDRFFQLDDNGYVLRRFSVYYDNYGRVSLDNFYNTSARADLLIGNTLVSTSPNFSTMDIEFMSYKNEDKRAFHVASTLNLP